ncbi:Neuralized-like protein 2, partial [Stegodyphus mimosarum]
MAEYVPASYRTPIPTMFHDYHGQNIVLSENNTAAYRRKGYAHGITFSREPLLPGEIFLLEIVNFEHGWIGNIRCGLTQKNPSSNFNLPPYALPGLVHEGHSWILPITRAGLNIFPQISINDLSPAIYESNDHIYTSRGCLPSSTLWPCQKLPTFAHSDGEETVIQESLNHSNSDNGRHMIPGGIGNRIGVTYIIRDGLAEMYIFLNGSVYGPCATEIPLN